MGGDSSNIGPGGVVVVGPRGYLRVLGRLRDGPHHYVVEMKNCVTMKGDRTPSDHERGFLDEVWSYLDEDGQFIEGVDSVEIPISIAKVVFPKKGRTT